MAFTGCSINNALIASGLIVLGIFPAWSVNAQSGASFDIRDSPPSELNPSAGGPASATLKDAAEFAWEEFFALNWPAGPQNGQFKQRDVPSTKCLFGDASAKCPGPLVWETFRGKEEIFPGQGNPPGYPGSSATSYGYDHLPEYNYAASTSGVPVTVCPGEKPASSAPWVNLDETDEISLASMYAGVVAATKSSVNSAPQLVRFLAKANRVEYEYVAAHQLWSDRSLVDKTHTFIISNRKEPPNDGNSYIILPNNSIEVKVGWRLLNPAELMSGRFHTAVVRYYEKAPSGKVNCYHQAVFGLVALHIIQKTELAPYFIYASFEQADNILDEKGLPVEDVDGRIIPNQAQPCRMTDQPKPPAPCPTTPSVDLFDTQVVRMSFPVPPEVVTVPPSAQYCTTGVKVAPKNRLYYLNTELFLGLPNGGFICVNQRDNLIPDVIVDANKRAHDLITAFSAQHGISHPVWQYYKLINVQYIPINKTHPGLFGSGSGENNPNGPANPSSYYLANIVVETNRTLQLFSGGLVGTTGGIGGTGSNSDYGVQFAFPGGTGAMIQSNMFFHGTGYNMGGCMGCHGGQGQIQGGDFSVIVARGQVKFPEAPAEPTTLGASLVQRNRLLEFSPPAAAEK